MGCVGHACGMSWGGSRAALDDGQLLQGCCCVKELGPAPRAWKGLWPTPHCHAPGHPRHLLAGLLLWRRGPGDLPLAALQLAGVAFAASFFIISIACDYRYLYFTDLAAIVGLVYAAVDPPMPWRRRD